MSRSSPIASANPFIARRRRFAPPACCDFAYKLARTRDELDAFWNLRRRVFCEEQRIFRDDDRDEHDAHMIPIVCVALVMGMEDEVVGVVRIDEREPGVWWGSRLGVRRNYRRVRRVSPSVARRNRHPEFWRNRSIGAGLILKAVTTAHAGGCHTFLAEVQARNVPLFESLHWRSLETIERHGLPHVRMQADLAYYPPAPLDELVGKGKIAS